MLATRTLRERILQTCAFEAIGIACVTPLFMAFYGGHASESLALMIAISLAVMIWAPLYGFIFDRIEGRRTGRVASDRPNAVRVLHAVLYELTAVSVTLPLAMAIGGLTFGQAIGLNIWLTLFYVAYAYGFFLIYDRLRPVRRAS
ncbi:PACE efflux transporter [Yoonia sp. R2331]|uniref:PACE efflux transporter n=1 Tax=Yoonia sp. R2331 TaxID=3237238 RepID=UPI0034E3F393